MRHFSSRDDFIDYVFQEFSDEIFRFSYTYVKRKDIAEDLTQEIFIKCYKNYHKFKSNSSIKTWIYSIAANHCKDYLRSGYAKYVSLSEKIIHLVKGQSKNPEEIAIERDSSQMLTDYILTLPVKYREVIFLYYFKELKISMIASTLKCNENTVKSRLRRAKILLKEAICIEGGNEYGKEVKESCEKFLP
ncbi:RNA polymerase sigma-70 factor, ECF subfamily [Halobacillus dabanensis]|uniref:RNA polymerase sigma-70 factor, ECF subfamily n=1 Tax=Halobacillus dabanensis TaxID=240302 RepID=A0A1I3V1Y4_HALDA|nr:sigma-70 family RNA polymerase sigma factor [Halobacillus dabanensis]SFJ89140.1 RNA polymerase sigma-70 factor, ECF subfamily [Halobacillus dabanensis]